MSTVIFRPTYLFLVEFPSILGPLLFLAYIDEGVKISNLQELIRVSVYIFMLMMLNSSAIMMSQLTTYNRHYIDFLLGFALVN